MSTHSITKIKDPEGQILLCLYGRYDGYFEGMGQDLANFIKAGRLADDAPKKSRKPKSQEKSNGMGGFASRLLAHFPVDTSEFSLCPTNTEMRDCWADFEYEIGLSLSGEIYLRGRNCYAPDKAEFEKALKSRSEKKMDEICYKPRRWKAIVGNKGQ